MARSIPGMLLLDSMVIQTTMIIRNDGDDALTEVSSFFCLFNGFDDVAVSSQSPSPGNFNLGCNTSKGQERIIPIA